MEERQLVLDAVIRYLRTHQPSVRTWSAQTQWLMETVLPDWSGVYLMTTLFEHARDRTVELPALRERWAPAIVATPVFGGFDVGDLRGVRPEHPALPGHHRAVRPANRR
jgi:hypothetical protein